MAATVDHIVASANSHFAAISNTGVSASTY
jgi:hypothetical protein